jgi:hypothetical protein
LSGAIAAAVLGGFLLAPALAAGAPAAPGLGPAALAAAARPAQYQQGQQRPPSVDQMLYELRRRLGLNAAQVPAFNAFAAVMRENAREAQGLRPPSQTADAVQMLSAELTFAEAEVRGLQRLLPALQGLYGVPSPAQRHTADGFFRQGPGR